MNAAPADRSPPADALATGVAGLDAILGGGYAARHMHLIEGEPGAGKTTLAMQFLIEGARHGERGLYITLSESREELQHAARCHGWSLEGIEIYELIPPELSLDPQQEQSVVYTADLELGETVRLVMAEVERIRPTRVVFDSLAEIRLLAQNGLRYRRQVLALKYHLANLGATGLLLDDLTEKEDNLTLHSIAHGVVRLEQFALQYGAERRRLRVYKMRARQFRGGFHDFVIRRGGIALFPRLIAAEHRGGQLRGEPLFSGVAGLDQLLGGGLDRGTGTLVLGPSGGGKSSLVLQYIMRTLEQGERALVVNFDEVRHVFLRRASGMGMDLEPFIETGQLALEQVDPAEYPPGEVVSMVCRMVQQHGVSVVVLDSLNGYRSAMLDENYFVLQIHELLSYLNQRGVVTLLVLSQQGLVGPMHSSVDLTYVSDTVVLLRFFEADGRIRRAISVLKKRTGAHEAVIREYRIDSDGLRVGDPLDTFHGVLTGVPHYTGSPNSLLRSRMNDEC
ncbi:MAG TPA: ATPase domain-containing protein [Acetobacteraceae bacterium]